jgi:hypothetical protein
MPMKRGFTVWLGCLAFIYSLAANAQTPEYGKVLFRVNSGGTQKASIDTSDVAWIKDNLSNPCPYVDTTKMGNKAFATADSITLDPSVPASTPYSVFKSERGLIKWDINTLEFDFPVESGKKVEVRLYFAEIYWDSPDVRVFDIILENTTMLSNYDIYAEAGADVGVMKSFETTSDGNLDIDLKRVKNQPKVNAIEIIEIKSAAIASIFGKKETDSKSHIYPNPFTDKFTLETTGEAVSDLRLFDYSGKELQSVQLTQSGNNGYLVDVSNEPKGIYFLQFRGENNEQLEMRKIIKY